MRRAMNRRDCVIGGRGNGSANIPSRFKLGLAASVANLKTALSLALDDDLALLRATVRMSNVTHRGVGLLGDQSCTGKAAAGLAFGNVAA